VYAEYDEPFFSITFEASEEPFYKFFLHTPTETWEIPLRKEAAREKTSSSSQTEDAGKHLYQRMLWPSRRKASGVLYRPRRQGQDRVG